MTMSEMDKARARKEAVDAVGGRPPSSSESRVDAALRRYLGSSMFTMLRGGKDRRSSKSGGGRRPDDEG